MFQLVTVLPNYKLTIGTGDHNTDARLPDQEKGEFIQKADNSIQSAMANLGAALGL